MTSLKYFIGLLSITLFGSIFANAQQLNQNIHPIPDAIYEVRYWQDMGNVGSTEVMVDTMYYFGNDRASFEYSNTKCVSYHCRATDSLIYALVPKFSGAETEWTMGNSFIRKLSSTTVPFRGRSREVHKVFIADVPNKNNGIGEYALLSKEFGVIYRWNTDREVYQLLRIDVAQNGRTLDKIDLLPMMDEVYRSSIFR